MTPFNVVYTLHLHRG